jgi:hypothetical protein
MVLTSSYHSPYFALFLNLVSPTEDKRTVVLHRMAIVRLQDEKNDDELCQISQRLSSWGSARAHTLAKEYVALDESEG